MKKVAQAAGLTVLAAFNACLTISYFFGFEPQMIARHAGPCTDKSVDFTDYMRRSIEHNGDTIGVRVLTTIAYPGAKLGFAAKCA